MFMVFPDKRFEISLSGMALATGVLALRLSWNTGG
jgi:hypothetical protein